MKRNRRSWVWFLVLLLGLSFSLAFANPKKNETHVKEKIKTSRLKINTLKNKIKTQRQKLFYVNLKEQDISMQLGETQDKLYRTRDNLNLLNIRINQLNAHLAIISRNISLLKKKLNKQKSLLSYRLKDIYENGHMDYIACVLDAETFADFVNRADFLSMIVDTDCSFIDQVNDKTCKLQAQERELEQTRAELNEVTGQYSEQENYLASLESTRQSLLNEVSSQREEISRSVQYLEHLTRQEEARLRQIIIAFQSSSGGTYRAFGMLSWPVSGMITSPFGYRVHPIYGGWRLHTGIDLAAHYGASIYAAADGTVIYSGWYGGYGNTVVLDHGGGYSTLYAHCSSLFFNEGGRVSRGQAIASVGSTGNSTGPHLHFEVRYHGDPVNPGGKLP